MKVFNNKFWVILFLFSFFKPAYFSTIHSIDMFYDIFRIISAVYIIAIYTFKKVKLSQYTKVLIFYRLYILIIVLLKGGDILTWFNRSSMIIFVCLIVEYNLAKNAKRTISALKDILSTLIFINLITWKPDGLYTNDVNGKKYCFLGLRTRIADSVFPAVCIAFIDSKFGKLKSNLKGWVVYIAAYITFLLEWVATAFLGINLLGILFVSTKTKLMNRLHPGMLAGIALLANISIVFFRVQNLFAFIIVGILNKSLTLTGRTFIWDSAMEVIKNSIVVGYGETLNGTFAFYEWQFWQGHSQLIQTLHDGGIIGCILFVYLNWIVVKELMKYRNHNFTKMISATLFIIYIMMITEIYGYYPYFYVLLTIGANIEILIKSYDNHLNSKSKITGLKMVNYYES